MLDVLSEDLPIPLDHDQLGLVRHVM